MTSFQDSLKISAVRYDGKQIMDAIERAKTMRLVLLIRWMSVLLVLISVGLSPAPAGAFDILLGTNETGSFSHFTGRILSRMINRHAEDIQCKAMPGPGDVHNLTNLSEGSLDIALIDSRMLLDAVNKTGNFEFLDIKYDNLRTLVPLYDVPVTLVVRKEANISSLEELKGKRINAGAPRSLQHLAVDSIMEAKNWSIEDFGLISELSSSQSQDNMAFCYGAVQAMVHIGVHPDSSLQQLFRLCKAGMVDMNDSDIELLTGSHPAFTKINIAADIYPEQPGAVTTFGTRTILVATEDLDRETAFKIVDAIFSSQKKLNGAHPSLSSFSLETALRKAAGFTLHPGAMLYFSEHSQR